MTTGSTPVRTAEPSQRPVGLAYYRPPRLGRGFVGSRPGPLADRDLAVSRDLAAVRELTEYRERAVERSTTVERSAVADRSTTGQQRSAAVAQQARAAHREGAARRGDAPRSGGSASVNAGSAAASAVAAPPRDAVGTRDASPARDGSSGRKGRKRVLVVDDEKDLVDLISYNLQRNGYDVVTAYNGLDAIDVALREGPDLVVLDLMLPGIDGTEVARRLRADPRTAAVPIVMLTAKAEETDVVVGLTLGADDYVTKPFSMKILLARLTTVLRRAEQGGGAGSLANGGGVDGGAVLRAGPLAIDQNKHEATVDGQPAKLTLTEFKLLTALVAARGRVLTRDQLMDKAMGTDVFVTDRAIDVHVTAIRKKLGDAAYLVHTVRGVGYRLQETPEAEG